MWEFKPLVGCMSNVIDENVKTDLTITISKNVGKKEFPPEVIQCYVLHRNLIIVPRFYPREYKANIKPSESIVHSYNSKLNPGNQECVYSAVVSQLEELGGCTLVLGTGEGKSFITREIVKYLGLRTLVVCNTTEIMNYWISEVFENTATQFAGRKQIVSGLTVGTIQTVMKQPRAWVKNFDFIVFDEVTEMTSEKRRAFFWYAPKYILGLTATPELKGARSKIFKWFCGPILDGSKLIGYNSKQVQWKGSVQAIHYFGPAEFTKPILSSIGYVSAMEMAKQFCSDDLRTDLILSNIMQLVAQGKNVFVFCTLCDYAKLLYDSLKCDSKAIIMGRERTAEIAEIAAKYQVVFTTVRFAAKGISIPKMDAIVLAQPIKSDSEQIIGRILRISGDVSSERIIVDIIDAATSLRSQYYERKKTYKKLGFSITKSIVKT